RGQGTFLSDDEITRVTEYVATDSPQFARELIELKTKDEVEATQPGDLKNRDELYEAAVDIVVRERRGSVSLLQRCLGIGYGRAARLIDFMAEDKIVGEYNGAQAREVLISLEDWEAMSAKGDEGGSAPSSPTAPLTAATVPPKPRRVTKILPGSDEPSDLEDDGPVRGPARRPTRPLTATGGAGGATAMLAAPCEEGSEADHEQDEDEIEESDDQSLAEWSELEDDETAADIEDSELEDSQLDDSYIEEDEEESSEDDDEDETDEEAYEDEIWEEHALDDPLEEDGPSAQSRTA
ncbi:MAG TPA: DNA translocase FtsK, partial [Lacipirellulaceae bacterium]|nr:DNA translocase FtsK [Lacipirellulaceae bacterium]